MDSIHFNPYFVEDRSRRYLLHTFWLGNNPLSHTLGNVDFLLYFLNAINGVRRRRRTGMWPMFTVLESNAREKCFIFVLLHPL